MRWKSSSILISFVVITISGVPALADCPSADLTGECFVDFEDFALMANQWLTGAPNIPDDMVYIPYGGFEMGDHFAEGNSDELPLHPVLLDSFFMGKYEVTNAQYCAYLNSAFGTGIYFSGGVVYGTGNNQHYCDTHSYDVISQIDFSGGVFSVREKGGRDMSGDPMIQVTWYGAAAYCNWRSQQEGYQALYDLSDPNWPCDFTKKGYRLPTEAEWEYAARGGNPNYRFPWGDTISHSQANYYADPCSYPYDVNPTKGFHPAWNDGIEPYTALGGSFSANGHGLYNIAGNVWEWCNDWYDGSYYDVSPYDNPQGPVSGTDRVLRGGGWRGDARHCRVAYRFRISLFPPGARRGIYGFRIVLDSN